MLTVQNDKVGIGTTSPTEDFEVQGDALLNGTTTSTNLQVGSNGSLIKEIIKIEGITAGDDRTVIYYPPGFNRLNSHVLSYKIRFNWNDLGTQYYSYQKDRYIYFATDAFVIQHNDQAYRNSDFQVILMRID